MSDRPAQDVEIKVAEREIEARSIVFKKELGLTDLALTQILFIVGLPWVGTAGKLGSSHVVFWLLAIVLFYLPSAAVVIHLNRQMPLEGGLYQWAKLGFNELTGYLVAWNLWLFAILNTSEIGLQLSTSLSYALGSRFQWMASNKWFITAANVVTISLLVTVSVVGLSVGKWLHKTGAAVMLLTFALLLLLPLLNLYHGSLTEYHPLRTSVPSVSLFNLNILGKLGFGALGGFEYVAIHAGECKNPSRAIGRSVALAAPIIALMFILGTSSVLALLKPDDIDLIGPIPQVLRVGFESLGFAGNVVPMAIFGFMAIRIAQSSVMFTGNTRLPMVAGWDHLLPGWFTRLHPRFKTPINSIAFVGIMTLILGLIGLVGVGEQEAFQLLWNASGIFYALTYLVMFAIPLFGRPGAGGNSARWLKAASASGLLMTVLYVVLSVLPIVQVESRLSFAAKISGVIVVANLVGAAIYLGSERRRRLREQQQASPVAFP